MVAQVHLPNSISPCSKHFKADHPRLTIKEWQCSLSSVSSYHQVNNNIIAFVLLEDKKIPFPQSTVINISINTWSTSTLILSKHSVDSGLIFTDKTWSVNQYIWVCRHSANYWPTVNWVLSKCPSRCRSSVNLVMTKYRLRHWTTPSRCYGVSTEGIDRHSTRDAFNTHDPKLVHGSNKWRQLSRNRFHLCKHLKKGYIFANVGAEEKIVACINKIPSAKPEWKTYAISDLVGPSLYPFSDKIRNHILQSHTYLPLPTSPLKKSYKL